MTCSGERLSHTAASRQPSIVAVPGERPHQSLLKDDVGVPGSRLVEQVVPAYPVAMIKLAHLAGRERGPEPAAGEACPALRQARDGLEHQARQVTDPVRTALGCGGGG